MNNDFKVSKNGTVLMITLGRDLITSNAPVRCLRADGTLK